MLDVKGIIYSFRDVGEKMNKKPLLYLFLFVAAIGVLILIMPVKILIRIIIFTVFIALVAPRIIVYIITDPDGVWNPPPWYQRYRISEYSPQKPFFQWWYFSLKDYETDAAFAFCYSISRPVKDKEKEGAYFLFATFSKETRCHIYYKYPLDQFKRDNDFDIEIEDKFSLKVIDSNETGLKLRITGKMNNPDNVWIAEGADKDTVASWDLEVNRVAGWYGQQDVEPLSRALGMISWNTYAYNSEVSGSVTLNGEKHEFTKTPRFRMYCDMNWGERFPTHLEDKNNIEYPWGWYYTGVPDPDPKKDFSMIAGVGRSVSNSKMIGVMNAKFASMYLRGKQVSARFGTIGDKKQDKGLPMLRTSTDGGCKTFLVERTNWIKFKDMFGTADIPLVQIVTIETRTMKFVMKFESKPENYNRLLFPTDGYCFSDFEALGVHCTTQLFKKTFQSGDLLKRHPVYELQDTWLDTNAGLEYGYKVDVTL
ncbi:MAG: hypothetical protein ACFFCS_03635 [Candidatus Hodarchaeota archaeon]